MKVGFAPYYRKQVNKKIKLELLNKVNNRRSKPDNSIVSHSSYFTVYYCPMVFDNFIE